MQKYTFQLFDSRNTSQHVDREMQTINHASMNARILSLGKQYHHVVVERAGAWEEWTGGELTAWSVPRGLGAIKTA